MYRQQETQFFPGYPGYPGFPGMPGFPSTGQPPMGYPDYSEGNIERRLRRLEREISRHNQRIRRLENRIGGMYGR